MSDAHHHTPVKVDEQFELTAGTRTKFLAAIAIGVILFIIGIFLIKSGGGGHEAAEGAAAAHGEGGGAEHHAWTARLWANLWLNNVWFTGIALIGVFFVAFQYVSYAGWSASIIRVPLAFGSFLPIGAVMALLVFWFGHHDLFHWTHPELHIEKLPNGQPNPEYDAIIAGKEWYLTIPFYLFRTVLYFGLWILMYTLIRKQSLEEDIYGGDSFWHKNTILGAVFLIIFGVSTSTSAWDWVMSIDPHWFSTLFGWYTFASWFVSGLAAITLVVVNLKESGYLRIVNQNHIHDLGKYMFAFSIFWAYLWIAQFLLIWYANLPEETIYFLERFQGHGGIYKPIFFVNVGINFFFPFLVLMTRDAKRQSVFLKIACVAILAGHWIDFYLMIMPGTVGSGAGFGVIEVGTLLIYLGAFAFMVATTMTKSLLIPRNHPMLEESIHHHI